MQDLKKLVYIFKNFQLRLLNSHGQYIKRSSLLGQLYDALDNSGINTDEEAEALLYPDKKSGSKFRQLKSVLRDRMLNSIAAFDPAGLDMSDYQKAYYACHKEWWWSKYCQGKMPIQLLCLWL